MIKLVTEQDAYNIGKVGTPVLNRLCTANRAEELGCTVSSYNGSRIVHAGLISSKKYICTIDFEIGSFMIEPIEMLLCTDIPK